MHQIDNKSNCGNMTCYGVDEFGNADLTNGTQPADLLPNKYKTSIINENDVSDSYKQVFEEYRNSTNIKLVQFVKDIHSGKNEYASGFLGYVTREESDSIRTVVDINAEGFEIIISEGAVNHINKRHGIKGQADHTMSNINDVGRIEFVMANYDDIYRTVNSKGNEVFSSSHHGSDGKRSPLITYEKSEWSYVCGTGYSRCEAWKNLR